MAKVGTAIVEVKPVLNEEALAALATVIERAVYTAVTQAMSRSISRFGTPVDVETLHRVQAQAAADFERAVRDA